MSIRIPIGSRVFAPSWFFTALTVLLCIVFFYLGRWQWHRGLQRQLEYDSFAAGAEQVIPLGSRGVDEVARFQRVSVVGHLDPDHQFLLDNRSYQGRPGFEVLTPLRREDGRTDGRTDGQTDGQTAQRTAQRTVIVDRGWVPFSGRRSDLPVVSLEAHDAVTIVGRVDNLPVPGLASGRAAPGAQAPWPKVTAFPSMAQLSAALGVPLEPQIILLDPKEADGYVRDWHPPGMEPMRHWSYALQWWSFAVLLFVLWVGLSLRKVAPGS